MLASVGLLVWAAASSWALPSLTATVATAPFRLDGRLDEEAWKRATPFLLTQQSPRPGEPTPYKTEVRVVVRHNSVYIGIRCEDPDPRRIAVHTMRRDDDVGGDDHVSIVLDPTGDRRTGYFFIVNAAGARIDGLISNSQTSSLDWDGIWDARTQRTKTGWTAEIWIPARSLTFVPGRGDWGLNVERYVPRDRTTLRWSALSLDNYLLDFSRAGTLRGMENLRQGKGLEFVPYAIARSPYDFQTSRVLQATTGGDVQWRPTPEMQTALTVNTDFAETEVDARQINLTRFPLFFPEKRGFFLEGSNQYDYGFQLGTDFIPFFSRKVGLLNGQQVPINAGFKANGRVDRWNIGMLDVETRRSPAAPAVNLLASRVSYDATDHLRVGTIMTNGDPQGLKSNTLAGADALWQTSSFRGDKNLLFSAWGAASGGDVGPGQRQAWGVLAEYPNDDWYCVTKYNEWGDAFDPALGFLPRPGTREFHGGCTWGYRPDPGGRLGWLRRNAWQQYYTQFENLRGGTQSWDYFVQPLTLELEHGETASLLFEPHYENLPTPFTVAPGVTVQPGGYQYNRLSGSASSSAQYPLRVGSGFGWGELYDGHMYHVDNSANWTSSGGHWQLGLVVQNFFGDMAEGSFVERLWQVQTAYALNPNVVLTSFLQYDTNSESVGNNMRLRWTFRPGNDLFIIWNRNWNRLADVGQPDVFAPQSELFAVKLRWTFRA